MFGMSRVSGYVREFNRGRDHIFREYKEADDPEVDILAPDNLGERAKENLHTPFGRSVEAPGRTKALEQAQPRQVTYDGRTGTIALPSRAAALHVKIKALGLP